MNKTVWALIIVVLVALGAVLLINQQNQQQQSQPAPTVMEEKTASPTPEAMSTPSEVEGMEEKKGEAKTFNLDGKPFSFSVKEMKVKQGDTVRVTFTNTQGSHDWGVDEFDVHTKVLAAGKSETVEFVADKKGTFEYYCSVGNHRAQGMVGKLIVE